MNGRRLPFGHTEPGGGYRTRLTGHLALIILLADGTSAKSVSCVASRTSDKVSDTNPRSVRTPSLALPHRGGGDRTIAPPTNSLPTGERRLRRCRDLRADGDNPSPFFRGAGQGGGVLLISPSLTDREGDTKQRLPKRSSRGGRGGTLTPASPGFGRRARRQPRPANTGAPPYSPSSRCVRPRGRSGGGSACPGG